jgi:hypothetical protein
MVSQTKNPSLERKNTSPIYMSSSQFTGVFTSIFEFSREFDTAIPQFTLPMGIKLT